MSWGTVFWVVFTTLSTLAAVGVGLAVNEALLSRKDKKELERYRRNNPQWRD